jgi:hypothetical protein
LGTKPNRIDDAVAQHTGDRRQGPDEPVALNILVFPQALELIPPWLKVTSSSHRKT